MDEAALLPVGPWALAAVATVLVVALSVPPGGPRPADLTARHPPLHRRTVAVVLLLLTLTLVVVGRSGPESELDNPVPALLVGLGWPLLLVVPGLLGLVRPLTARRALPNAWPAVLTAVAVAAALTVPAGLDPDGVATALAAYAVVVTAAAVAVGSRTAAARFEVLGLLASWLAVGRRLPQWAAPPGALAVVAVLLGGAWFERYERTAAWSAGLPGRGDTVLGLVAALAVAALAAVLLHLTTRDSRGTAAAVLLPLTAGVVVAGVTRRALISAQLLADQATGSRAVDPDPLGVAGGQVLALVLVVLGGGLAGAVLARRTGEGAARLPGVAVLLGLVGASAWLVLQP